MNLLFEAGADVNAKNHDTVSPTDIIFQSPWNGKVASVLLENGADINQTMLDMSSWRFLATKDQNQLITDIIKHIKLLKVMGLFVNSKNEEFYSKWQPVYLKFKDEKDFGDQCADEIRRMREIRINYRLSLYDILTVDVNEVSNLIANAQFRAIIDSVNFAKNFPIYGFMLKLQFKKGSLRRNLFERSKESFIALSGFQLSDGCPEMIFQYLDITDLKNFITASYISDKEIT